MDLLNEINKAQVGSKNLKITFKQACIGDIQYLISMHQSGIIKIENDDLIILEAVRESGKWGHNANRMLTISLTDKFDQSWFADRMKRALENACAV